MLTLESNVQNLTYFVVVVDCIIKKKKDTVCVFSVLRCQEKVSLH